jgi:hypothetical protein
MVKIRVKIAFSLLAEFNGLVWLAPVVGRGQQHEAYSITWLKILVSLARPVIRPWRTMQPNFVGLQGYRDSLG